MRLVCKTNNGFEIFRDYYLNILLEREAIDHFAAFKENRKNQPIFGYRGEQFMDAGYIYAPYIPQLETPTVNTGRIYDAEIFKKYAGREINKSFYGVIKFGELDHGSK